MIRGEFTRRSGAIRADQSGSAALQFAFILPVLIAFIFGAFQLGLALYSGAAVRSAVQRSSRMLITDPATTDAQLQSAIRSAVVSVPVQDIAVSSTREVISTSETVARVAWTYSYMIQTPFIPTQQMRFDSSIVVPMAPTN